MHPLSRECAPRSTCLTPCSLKSMSGDDAWHTYMRTALELIKRLGGPEQLLSSAGTLNMSPTRFVLEQIAIRDVMGCLTTGQEPTLFGHPISPWFFVVEKYSQGDAEWESVERMFGMSRKMVDFVARVSVHLQRGSLQTCVLLARVYESAVETDPKTNHNASCFFDDKDNIFLLLNSQVPPINGSPDHGTSKATVDWSTTTSKALMETEAQNLMTELDLWDSPTNYIPYHHRTQYVGYFHSTVSDTRVIIFIDMLCAYGC